MLLKTGIPSGTLMQSFPINLVEDHKIRTVPEEEIIQRRCFQNRDRKRASDKVKIILYTAKPGVVIGKGGGAEIEKTKSSGSEIN